MSPSKKDVTQLVIGGEPRIDFLPVEIKKRKENRRSRRSLILLVVVAVGVCIAGYVFSAGAALQSQIQLDAARSQTQVLLQQQGEFVEARTVASEIVAAKGAAVVGSATEIMWKKYMKEIVDVLPKDSDIKIFTVVSQTTQELTPVSVIPLEKPRVATVSFGVETTSYALASELITALEELPGYADATATAVVGSTDSKVLVATVVLHVNSDVFERRFFEQPAAETTDGTAATTTDEG